MKVQGIALAIAILAVMPVSANAQAFGNLNINLNDVMVGQRMQDMSQRLSNVDASAFKQKKERKHDKKNRNHRMALLHDASAQSAVLDQGQNVDGAASQAVEAPVVPQTMSN